LGLGSWGGAASPSLLARGSGERCELTAGFGVEPRLPKDFPLFSALRMASPGAIILFTVDYHAAIRGQDPRGPLAHAPASTSAFQRITKATSMTGFDSLVMPILLNRPQVSGVCCYISQITSSSSASV